MCNKYPDFYSATNLTSSELERLAHLPLELFLPIHELLKPPMAKREKKRPLNRFLLYRRNYAARFPISNRPRGGNEVMDNGRNSELTCEMVTITQM